MESSTVVALLVVVGLGALAWYWFDHQTDVPAGQQLPPTAGCSGTGEQVVGAIDSAVINTYAKGSTKMSPDSFCAGAKAFTKSVAMGTTSWLADHTTTRDTLLFVPGAIGTTWRTVTSPVSTGKAAGQAIGTASKAVINAPVKLIGSVF